MTQQESEDPRPIVRKRVAGAEVVRFEDENTTDIRGIQDEMGEGAVMDLLVRRDGDVFITLRDGSKPDKEELTICFTALRGGTSHPEASEILRLIARGIYENDGRIIDICTEEGPGPILEDGEWKARNGARVMVDRGCVIIRNVQGDLGGEVLMDLVETEASDMTIVLKRNPKLDWGERDKYLQYEMQFNTVQGGTGLPGMAYSLRRLAHILALEK